MLLSEHFGVVRSERDTWFDPVLDFDVHLFIDPFLVFADPIPPFEQSHGHIVAFFNQVFEVAARAGGRENLTHRVLLDLLTFPEPAELCLGYTAQSTRGAGSGSGFARVILGGINESIAQGILEVTHFEEIGLLHEGIGCDRISDITASILKPQLVRYTQEVCHRHRVPMRMTQLRHARFNGAVPRWENAAVELPLNPFSGNGILLVPSRFLSRLPTITPEDFWDYAWVNENRTLRDQFGVHMKSAVRRSEIIRIARANQFLVRAYLAHVEGRPRPVHYDLDTDQAGLYQWDRATREYVRRNPLRVAPPRNEEEFSRFLDQVVEEFRAFVMSEGGHRLLWNDQPPTPKPESAAQLLFWGIAKSLCRANDIDMSREVETGRGPVDFKFSNGYSQRALLEVKLANNGRFWHGLERQLPTYLESADVSVGIFLVIAHYDRDLRRIDGLQNIVRTVAQRVGASLRSVIVTAMWPASASRA